MRYLYEFFFKQNIALSIVSVVWVTGAMAFFTLAATGVIE